MKKIKYLLLSLVLSLVLLFSGCIAMDNTDDWEEQNEQQNLNNEKDDAADVDNDDKSGQDDGDGQNNSQDSSNDSSSVEYGESYTSKEEVALYLHLYEELPPNFITKKEAKNLGWDSSKGNLSKVAPGMSIGGDYFGNYEGVLPEGKDYHECDIDSDGGYRNAKRIVYSDDGCIYYTEDHYTTFELLYGEE